MIEKEALLSRLEEADILSFENSELNENFDDNFISLEDDGIENLISFVIKNKLNTLFYYYRYPAIEYFLITDKLLSEYDDEFIEIYRNKIEEHNSRINAYDFTKPLFLHVYAIYQGYFVGNFLSNDYYYENLGMASCLDKLKEFYNEYESQEDRLGKKEQARKDFLVRMKDYILNDPNFHKATNESLRKNYKTYLRENNEEFREYERKEHYNSLCFIDDLWREYKIHKNDLENVYINLDMYMGFSY